ncbi:FeoB-associated Cys-rich membrane protein [Enterococcus sp. BWB1-3]|nr:MULTISPECIES: FeoB-associated Cys-rich membrane protein [unclassified Enterococcus]MBL1228933.1 FeoB-associated Cys-rich membrane protein [Enterococcus sp. BWB1-3]MCB5951523.1 FeoB-associated Cys-rich membrane protein [Enterococcus sp. BWT-B8]MCB5954611.1 FeoB-associated Cys-rich membrane protein [Enterococcus sp. CWB-B31]
MATIILSVLIFGSAGYVVYAKLKKGQDCSDCHTTCPVKKEQDQT